MQIDEATTDEELRDIIDSDEFDFRFECGFCQPSKSMTLHDRQRIISCIALHFLCYSCKAELDEFRVGLSKLGFIDLLRDHPCLRSLFQARAKADQLTADQIQDLLEPVFSPIGSNARTAEELAVMYFIDLLHEIEGALFFLPFHLLHLIIRIYFFIFLQIRVDIFQ